MNPYWIKTEGVRLAIIPRPRAVVSALTAAENEELGLVEESRCCQSRGIEFLSFPIEDRSVPNSPAEFTELVNSVTNFLRKGKAVAVHCRAALSLSEGGLSGGFRQRPANGQQINFERRLSGLKQRLAKTSLPRLHSPIFTCFQDGLAKVPRNPLMTLARRSLVMDSGRGIARVGR